VNTYWVACSYSGVTGVENAAGQLNVYGNGIASGSATGFVTSHAGDKLISVYSGYFFNGFPNLVLPANLVLEGSMNDSFNNLWVSDETISASGVRTGSLIATSSQPLSHNAGFQLLMY
jgi:hypothetical protein